jgi:hypothetical protein
MNPHLHSILAQQRIADLRRAAANVLQPLPPTREPTESFMLDHHLTIRAAPPHDDGALQRLARSERRPRIGGRALVAERDGLAIAAVALTSGRVATDSSSATANAVRRLRYRRYQLLRQSGGAGPAWSLLRRLTPQPAAS